MKRPETWVGTLFVVSILSALGLFAVYIAGGQPQAEGALLFLALGGLGAGLMLWSRGLMRGTRNETQSRHHGVEPSPSPEEAAGTMVAGVEQLRRRGFLFGLLAAAAGALGLAAIFPVRSLGEAPGSSLFRTKWRSGSRMVDVDGNPVSESTLGVDAFTTVFPEDAPGSADSQAVLIRADPSLLPDQDPALQGYVAFSKICTHAGCALGLYLASQHQLRCPCHQSTFDVLDGAKPVYGPAPRALPSLPIRIEDDGAIVATGDFSGPVGPSFWELDES